MHRGIALGVPGLALATAGGVLAEVRRAANAPLPAFEDHDASGRYGSAGGEPVHLVTLGDSSLTGPGLAHGSLIWIARLAAALPWDVQLTSRARGGSRVRDVLSQQAPLAMRDRPDLFVVAVGANDVIHLTPTRQYEAHLRELLDRLRTVAPVVTLGIGDLSVIPRIPRSLRVALARRCVAVDRIHQRATAGLPGVIRVPVAELSDPHFRRERHHLFADDHFHPNDRGHALWAELFATYVQDTLSARCSPSLLSR